MKFLQRILNIAIVLAFTVLALGAYTRLTNAGLGCPDWPGCYGQMRVSTLLSEHRVAQARFPDQPIELQKARVEMIHRYAAGTLILMMLGSLGLTLFLRQRGEALSLGLPVFLCVWIACQAALGMWTVTWRLLPWVVMMHLMFGAILFASLVLFRCTVGRTLPQHGIQVRSVYFVVAAGLIAAQMLLGGWVSANYAGVACIGFPKCNGVWFPTAYLPAIQMVHRFGALLVTLYLSGLALYTHSNWIFGKAKLREPPQCTRQYMRMANEVLTQPKIQVRRVYMRQYAVWQKVAWGLLSLLGLQLLLGILNVLYFLPLPVALMHHLVAVLLFTLCVVMAWGQSCKSP